MKLSPLSPSLVKLIRRRRRRRRRHPRLGFLLSLRARALFFSLSCFLSFSPTLLPISQSTPVRL